MKTNDLAQSWLLAKAAEDKAKKQRLETEKSILEELGDKSQTVKGNGFKITTSAGTNIKVVDTETIGKMVKTFGDKLPIKAKYDLQKKEFAFLEKANPELASEILSCCVEKPRKTSVKVEVI